MLLPLSPCRCLNLTTSIVAIALACLLASKRSRSRSQCVCLRAFVLHACVGVFVDAEAPCGREGIARKRLNDTFSGTPEHDGSHEWDISPLDDRDDQGKFLEYEPQHMRMKSLDGMRLIVSNALRVCRLS